MKKIIYLLVILSFVLGCKENKNGTNGTIRYNISYTNSAKKLKTGNNDSNLKYTSGDSDSLYTQFGDYITSLTPNKFTAKFQTIRFSDGKNNNIDGHLLELVNNNAAPNAPERFADFSNNSTVNVIPILYGTDLNNAGSFTSDEINFIYFYFFLSHFYQEAALPIQYNGINLSQFNNFYSDDSLGGMQYNSDSVIINNVLKVKHYALINDMFPDCNGCPRLFVFGNTNSTYISYTEGNNPIWNMGNPVIRSNAYTAFTLYRPQEGETLNLNTIMSFNCTNLIQIYAGNDNIPYTSDDVFVYAPNFWERLSLQVVIN
jgi:hypothetical protein